MKLSSQAAAEFIEIVLDCPIDLQSFGRVEAFVLDKSVLEVSEMFDAFTADLVVSLPMLVLHTVNRNWEGARSLAHRLKGAAASLGATTLWDNLEEVESTAKAGVVTPQQIRDLEQELEATLAALRQHLA
jgi:HPt (histidine-containing phosphotransfer) domain-containing protein